jgi:peptide/nickel transport system substrate-binding protein
MTHAEPHRSPQFRGAWTTLAVLLIATGGCSRLPEADEAATVNFLIESSPTNLDPRMGTDALSEHLDGLLFDSLLAHDAQMNTVPDLAERWETPDPLTYVFHLRRGVRFHDGRRLTSRDVKFTFDSILSGAVKSPKRGTFGVLDSIETPNAETVVFHLHEPYASFLWNLTRPGVGIVPEGSGTGASERPIGTGPFRFVSMTADEEIVLERNSGYFGDSPPVERAGPDRSSPSSRAARDPRDPQRTPAEARTIERVRFRIVPDAIVRALELRKGTADVACNSLTPDMAVMLAKQPGIAADEQTGTTLAYVAFNFDDPVLAHREVRQALALATDRATLIRYLLRGQAQPASSLLPPNHWAYEPNVVEYGYDLARAERLLDSAGFRRGADGVRFHLTLKTSTEESARLLGEALADQWRLAGVALELRSLEFATFYSDITHGSFQLYTFRWVGANSDPDIFEYVFSSKKMPPEGANRGHYRNQALDRLIGEAHVEMDPRKRKAILSQMQKTVAEDEPYITLWYPDNVCVHRTRLTGMRIPPSGDYEFLDGAKLQ